MTRRITEEPWTQLATRIPKSLHRRVRLYCVTNGLSQMDFVAEALEAKLGKGRRAGRRGPSA